MFPKYRSHYAQKKSASEYIGSHLTINKLYELYKEECIEIGVHLTSRWVYTNIFTTEFNLHFKPPQKDTCKTYDIMNIRIEAANENEREALTEQRQAHQIRAESIFDNLRISPKNACIQTKVITFDLEKTLQLPFLRTDEVYYSKQLSPYNLGIHYFPKDQGIMHLWTENEGKRFRRCILMLESCFAKNIDEHVKTIIGFSDACDCLIRNYNVARYMTFSVNTLKKKKTVWWRSDDQGRTIRWFDEEAPRVHPTNSPWFSIYNSVLMVLMMAFL